MASVAVVGSGAFIDVCRSSRLLTELGGLRASSSDRRVVITLLIEAESRRSAVGFEDGGGMLTLGLSTGILLASTYGFRRRSPGLFAPKSEWVEGALPGGFGGIDLPLAVEEDDKTVERAAPSAF